MFQCIHQLVRCIYFNASHETKLEVKKGRIKPTCQQKQSSREKGLNKALTVFSVK